MIKRYALIEDNFVVNIIVWDTSTGDVQDLTPLLAIESDVAQIGDEYINGEFITPQ